MDNLFGSEKPIDFEFKTTKGNKTQIKYTPSLAVKVSDKKAFEGHLVKVADMFEKVAEGRAKASKQIEKAKVEDKPKPKALDVVEDEGEEDTNE